MFPNRVSSEFINDLIRKYTEKGFFIYYEDKISKCAYVNKIRNQNDKFLYIVKNRADFIRLVNQNANSNYNSLINKTNDYLIEVSSIQNDSFQTFDKTNYSPSVQNVQLENYSEFLYKIDNDQTNINLNSQILQQQQLPIAADKKSFSISANRKETKNESELNHIDMKKSFMELNGKNNINNEINKGLSNLEKKESINKIHRNSSKIDPIKIYTSKNYDLNSETNIERIIKPRIQQISSTNHLKTTEFDNNIQDQILKSGSFEKHLNEIKTNKQNSISENIINKEKMFLIDDKILNGNSSKISHDKIEEKIEEITKKIYEIETVNLCNDLLENIIEKLLKNYRKELNKIENNSIANTNEMKTDNKTEENELNKSDVKKFSSKSKSQQEKFAEKNLENSNKSLSTEIIKISNKENIENQNQIELDENIVEKSYISIPNDIIIDNFNKSKYVSIKPEIFNENDLEKSEKIIQQIKTSMENKLEIEIKDPNEISKMKIENNTNLNEHNKTEALINLEDEYNDSMKIENSEIKTKENSDKQKDNTIKIDVDEKPLSNLDEKEIFITLNDDLNEKQKSEIKENGKIDNINDSTNQNDLIFFKLQNKKLTEKIEEIPLEQLIVNNEKISNKSNLLNTDNNELIKSDSNLNKINSNDFKLSGNEIKTKELDNIKNKENIINKYDNEIKTKELENLKNKENIVSKNFDNIVLIDEYFDLNYQPNQKQSGNDELNSLFELKNLDSPKNLISSGKQLSDIKTDNLKPKINSIKINNLSEIKNLDSPKNLISSGKKLSDIKTDNLKPKIDSIKINNLTEKLISENQEHFIERDFEKNTTQNLNENFEEKNSKITEPTVKQNVEIILSDDGNLSKRNSEKFSNFDQSKSVKSRNYEMSFLSENTLKKPTDLNELNKEKSKISNLNEDFLKTNIENKSNDKINSLNRISERLPEIIVDNSQIIENNKEFNNETAKTKTNIDNLSDLKNDNIINDFSININEITYNGHPGCQYLFSNDSIKFHEKQLEITRNDSQKKIPANILSHTDKNNEFPNERNYESKYPVSNGKRVLINDKIQSETFSNQTKKLSDHQNSLVTKNVYIKYFDIQKRKPSNLCCMECNTKCNFGAEKCLENLERFFK